MHINPDRKGLQSRIRLFGFQGVFSAITLEFDGRQGEIEQAQMKN